MKSNDFQAIRYDFQLVSKFEPFAFQLEAPGSKFEATWQEFTRQGVLLASALEALTVSLERYQGISEALTKYQSMRHLGPDFVKEHAQYKIVQTQAVADNATACARLVDTLLHLRPQINATWLEIKEQLRSAALPAALFTPQEIGSRFAELWKASMSSFQASFRLNWLQMDAVTQGVEQMIRQQNFPSELPQTLLNERWQEVMQTSSRQFRDLAAAYANLSAALRADLGLPPVEPNQETLGYSLLLNGVRVANEDALTSRVTSGIRLTVEFWVPKRNAQNGWWGVVQAGGSPANPADKTQSAEVFLLPLGQYDVYWKQDHYHQPLLLAAGVEIKEGELATVLATSGMRMTVADWVPKRDKNNGWWGVTPAGQPPGNALPFHWSRLNDPLLLPPGQYDAYWKHDHYHQPLLLASDITVQQDHVADVHADSGIQIEVADWIPKRDKDNGWWGVTPAGRPPGNVFPLQWSRVNEPLLLLPLGQYDVYWKQDHYHQPLLLAAGVEIKEGELATVLATSGMRIAVADWVPQRDYKNGWWGVTPAGQPPGNALPFHWSRLNDPLLLPPGQYDAYLKQDHYHQPFLLISGITLGEGQVAKVQASSGIQLKLAPNARDLDAYYGQWGVIASGGKSNVLLNWVRGRSDQPLLVPPGTYDIIWQQDDTHKPESIKQDVTVKEHVLIEVEVQPSAGPPPGGR